MKIIYTLAIGLIFFETVCSKEIVVSEICEKFHQRSYCILRLSKAMELIHKNNKKKYCPKICNKKFSNTRVIACIKSMRDQNTIQPFFNLWNDIKRYKYLDDSTLTYDFTKMFFILQHNIVSEAQSKKNGSLFDIKISLEGRSFTETTTVRNYYAHRLSEALQFLKKVNCSQWSLFELGGEGCNCEFITDHTFQNEDIKDCVKKMETKKSVLPLITLGSDFTNCKLIQDEIFLKEFVLITFLALRNIFENNIALSKKSEYKATSELILYTYHNLEKLPLEEILEAIDLLHKELPSLLEKYEFNSKMKWRQWFKKYWWTPVTIGAVMGLRILWIFKKDSPPPGNSLLSK